MKCFFPEILTLLPSLPPSLKVYSKKTSDLRARRVQTQIANSVVFLGV